MLIAGSGPLEEEFAPSAQSGRQSRDGRFSNQTEMPACYAASDVLVLPSTRRETWGLVANEALACSCPIIVSDAVGSAPDLAADGMIGRMYPLGDTRRLADAIGDAIDSPRVAAIHERSNASSVEIACLGF